MILSPRSFARRPWFFGVALFVAVLVGFGAIWSVVTISGDKRQRVILEVEEARAEERIARKTAEWEAWKSQAEPEEPPAPEDPAAVRARHLLFHGSGSWDERRMEARELLGESGGPTCKVGALRVWAAWPDREAVGLAAESYGDCALRTDVGDQDVLMEVIGVGVAAHGIERAPAVVRTAPATIASNFHIKSTHAMCSESVPDAPGLRDACMKVLAR